MLGPIPNSLGAGAYNGSFMPHGLVTFSSRGNIVIIRQEICLDAGVVTTKTVIALYRPNRPLVAGYVTNISTDAGFVDRVTQDGGFVDTLTFIGGIEECD